MAFGGGCFRGLRGGGLGSQSPLGRRLEGQGPEGSGAGRRLRAPSERLGELEDPEMGASNAFGGPHPKSQAESDDRGLGDGGGACDPEWLGPCAGETRGGAVMRGR